MVQPVRVRYVKTGSPMQADFRYDTGLEGTFAAGTELFDVRLIAHNPMWQAVYDTAASLPTQSSLTVRRIVGRIDGAWNAMGSPVAGSTGSAVNVIAVGPDEDVYVGGCFTGWDSSTSQDNVTKWSTSDEAWSSLSAGLNGQVLALAFDAGSTLWAGGAFTSASNGATELNRVGQWDGTQWSAAASGLDDTVKALAVNSSGCVWAGGEFTSDVGSGSKTLNYVGYWTGGSWLAAASGLDDNVNDLLLAANGDIWAAGDFTSDVGSGSKTLNRVGYWDGTSWNAAGSGFNAAACALAEDPAGNIYAGGAFTTDGSGSTTLNYVAKWNGTQWSALGSGMNDGVGALLALPDGRLLAGGDFTQADGQTLPDRVARWNGATWHQLDIDLPGTPTVSALAYRKRTSDKFDIFLGSSASGTATISSAPAAAVIDNIGQAPAYPIIRVKRSGGSSATLSAIRNETTGRELLFDLSLLDGEEVTIDLRPGQRSITSDYRGNLLNKLLPNSDFATWKLRAGENEVYTYIEESGTPTLTATIQWRPTHFSVDEVVDA